MVAGARRTRGGSDPVPSRRSRSRALTIVGAVIVAAVMFLGGWLLGSTGARAGADRPGLQTELLSAPDARLLPSTVDGAAVSYLVSRVRDGAELLATDLPDPGENRVYQLWVVSGDRAASAGVIRGGGAVEVAFSGTLAGADALALTREPAPAGSATPGPRLSRVAI